MVANKPVVETVRQLLAGLLAQNTIIRKSVRIHHRGKRQSTYSAVSFSSTAHCYTEALHTQTPKGRVEIAQSVQ
jgi:hypothetical protein